MANRSKKKGPQLSGCIVDSIFSWSISDVLNQNLFKHKVKGIPLTFPSANRYMSSFIQPLVEEIRADLSSNMKLISKAPTCEIMSVETSKKKHYNSTDLFYHVKFVIDYNDLSKYIPGSSDLVVLTDVVPKCIDDLSKPNRAYTVAIVKGISDEDREKLVIRASRPIVCQKYMQNNARKERLFAVFLTNMITNLRISNALDIDPQVDNLSIINAVLQANNSGGNCVECSATQSLSSDDTSHPWSGIQSFALDDSQEAAVLSCITTMRCVHRNTVKLIWGPPGTGKTKTVGVLLFGFLSLKCRTITCAPTNIAVIQVTRRLFGLVKQSLEYDTYGLGDVVLFGNNERMKVKEEHRDLLDIFYDHRVDVLRKCYAQHTGWKASIESLICLLEEPEVLYSMYLETNGKEEQENIEDVSKSEDEDSKRKSQREEGKEGLYNDQEPIIQSEDQEDVLNQAGNKDSQCESEQKEGEESICNKKVSFFITLSEALSRITEEKRQKRNETDDCVLTMEEFLRVCFKFLSEQMRFCIVGLYTHLPTSVLPLEKFKLMIHCLELIQSFASWLLKDISSEGSQEFLSGFKVRINRLNINNFKSSGEKCLQALKSLHGKFNLPKGLSFCLKNALLIFCTASTSAKLHGEKPFDMLVIDEAAQLKECESAIPLQLPGLRHAILVGDERQLPAMVQSKISEKAEFGRSLFKRLVLLGQKKHLLKIQYRMHPAISSFPNKNFYDNLIMDAPNVKQSSHAKEFLQSPMYGAFSFINVSYGKEELDGSHSLRNMVEVSVACEIVAALSRESATQKRRISVGIISPYKAQVFAIHDIISKKYPNDSQSQFLVTVRSVDGFQGGEDDIIIISTVRCNGRGSVGFLSNFQRTNVALTRARHCLWILGNSQTLIKSGSVWKKLVEYAKDRGSIYNCEEDDNLARAISYSLCKHNRLDVLLKNDILLFRNAKWQMTFSPDFITNLMRIRSTETRMATIELLGKLSTGWRMPHEVKRLKSVIEEGISSELLQLYEVDKRLTLIWSTDTAAKGNARCILQVVKVWDIQPISEIPKIANHLDAIFKNYTIEKINQCQHKCNEGTSEVPMRWKMDSAEVEKHETSAEQFLSKSFSSLSLTDKSVAQKRTKRLHEKKLAKKVAAEANKLNPQKTTASLADKSGTSKRKIQVRVRKIKGLGSTRSSDDSSNLSSTSTTSKPKSRQVSSKFNPVSPCLAWLLFGTFELVAFYFLSV